MISHLYDFGWEPPDQKVSPNPSSWSHCASAVNEVTLANAATGNGPIISSTGETNVDLNLNPKGSGVLKSGTAAVKIAGTETIFIPSPNVAEDHQTKNALAVVTKNGALLLKESELEMFKNMFGKLSSDESLQQKLSKNIKALALPNATKDIVKEIEKLIHWI